MGDASRIKPAPDLYLKAAEKLELEPSDCLVVEDSLNGKIAAQEAGCDCVVIPSRLTSVIDFGEVKAKLSSVSDLSSVSKS